MIASIFDDDTGGPMFRCTDIAGRVLWLVPISAVEQLRAAAQEVLPGVLGGLFRRLSARHTRGVGIP